MRLERFTKIIESGAFSAPVEAVPLIVEQVARFVGPLASEYFVPPVATEVIAEYLQGWEPQTALDPAAGLGAVMAAVQVAAKPRTAFAVEINKRVANLGEALNGTVDWRTGDFLSMADSIPDDLDIVASSLPLGMRARFPYDVTTKSEGVISLGHDQGHQLLVASARKLRDDGAGLFVTTPSFFWSQRSPFKRLADIGLGVEAALALPPGAFAPVTNIQTCLVIIRKRMLDRIFVGQLTTDPESNYQLLASLRSGIDGTSMDLGRFVSAESFVGIEALRTAELFSDAEQRFGYPGVHLIDLMIESTRGRRDKDFQFPQRDNAVYIPTVGISDVVDSLDDLKIKPQNYLQVVISPAKSRAKFVAHFLNTELGRAIREESKRGATIGHFTNESLKTLRLFVPPLDIQERVLAIQSRIDVEHNSLLGLRNELEDLQRQLWRNPDSSYQVRKELEDFANRSLGGVRQQAAIGLDQWLETLPYPLASILRAWYGAPTSANDRKFSYLLRFFEASAEFFSVLLLSAFTSSPNFYEQYRPSFIQSLGQGNLKLERPDFGVWQQVVSYLAKRVRILLDSDQQEDREICAVLFSDPSTLLPTMLSNKQFSAVFDYARQVRNDWQAHGGAISESEAHELHDELVGQLHAYREATADGWTNVQLVQPQSCIKKRVAYNDVSVLMGSNSGFLSDRIELGDCLDTRFLYLIGKDSDRPLQLLPLIQLGSYPPATRGACYFYNRKEQNGFRFIAYQTADRSDRREEFAGVSEALTLIVNGGTASAQLFR